MMNMYKILVADDESLTRERIISLLKHYPNYVLLAETSNGAETLNAIKTHKPDVIFLDIKMPLLNGFEVLKLLKEDDYKILVFITAYDQYAIEAFENGALDYLLKPFDEERFGKLMKRVEKQLLYIPPPKNKHILIKEKNEIVKLKIDDIIYLRSDNNYVRICLDKDVLRKRISLNAIQDQLNSNFHRIHRFYIINKTKILKMKHIYHGDYLFSMSNGKSIPSSKTYRKTVKSIMQWL